MSWSIQWSRLGRFARIAVVGAALIGSMIARAGDDPDTEVAKRLFREGAAYYDAGDYQRALEAFEKAKVAKPVPAFDFNIGRCFDRLGRWSDALAAYERFAATTSDPADLKEANERIPQLRTRLKEASDRAAADEHYRIAVNRYNAGDYTGAVDEFKFAYRAVPDVMLLYNIAQSYRLAGDARNAINYYEQFLKEAPKSPLRTAIELRVAELKKQVKPAKSIAVIPGTPSNARPGAAPSESGSERLAPLAEIIKSHREGFRACFDGWSRLHPGIAGKVTLSFYLDPDGVLNQANAETKGFDAPDVAACIVAFARTLEYPAAPNAKYTRFTYPFDFKPLVSK